MSSKRQSPACPMWILNACKKPSSSVRLRERRSLRGRFAHTGVSSGSLGTGLHSSASFPSQHHHHLLPLMRNPSFLISPLSLDFATPEQVKTIAQDQRVLENFDEAGLAVLRARRLELEKLRLLLAQVANRERTKREILEQEFDRMIELTKPPKAFFKKLIEDLKRRDSNRIFCEPVTEELAPDYFSVIERPMDFQTMLKKNAADEYATIAEIEADFQLMCTNATVYNSPDSWYHQVAARMPEKCAPVFQAFNAELDQFYEEQLAQLSADLELRTTDTHCLVEEAPAETKQPSDDVPPSIEEAPMKTEQESADE
eukprot:m.345849 g.345849  ORF g.345849 m.345849 type:complete len:314 (-) comp55820_c0_seq1:90-1031(-)